VAAVSKNMRVIDTSTLVVELYLTTEELAAVRQAKAVSVQFPRHGGHLATASLARLDPQFDPVTRKRRVEFDLAGDAAPEAIGGLEVIITISIPDPSGALLIPRSFMHLSNERHSVRTKDGRDILVTVLRQQGASQIVVLPDKLTPEVILVP
jgi:hypothetical protein